MWTSFWKYKVKQNIFFLIKKEVVGFDKKIVTCQKKRTDDPREESITENPEEESITEDSKKTLSLKTLNRTLSLRNLKWTLPLRTLRRFRTLAITFAPQKTLFRFLMIAGQRVGDEYKFLCENFGLGRPRLHATVT